jgi:U3 small nucleolar RNA-associated protein 4
MSSSTSSRPPALAVQRSTLPLHRVRFFDRTPSPITALAFAPTPLPPAHDPSVSAKGKGRLDRVQNGAAGGGSGNGPASQIGTPELGVLVLARDSGDVEVWGWVEPEGEGQGNWVLEKVSDPYLNSIEGWTSHLESCRAGKAAHRWQLSLNGH